MKHFQKHSWSEWWGLIKSAVADWSDDYAPSMGAALSYYSVFSMGPLLVLVISIAGLVFGQDAARGQLFAELQSLMGADAAKSIQDMLAALSKPSHGVTASVISIGVLVIGATSVFGELQDALDRIWRAPDRPQGSGIWNLLRSRFLSFGMVLGIAFLLMVSLVVTAAVSALGKWWGGFFGSWEVLLQIINLLVGLLLTTAVFGMIYKFMPRVAVQWHDVWWGAAATSLLFTVGKFLIGLYIGKTGVASGFGAAGSIAVVFVWVYYSAQIFLLGAEFTWVYAQRFGSRSHQAPAPVAATAPARSEPVPATAAAAAQVAAKAGDPASSGGAPTAAGTATSSAKAPAAVVDTSALVKWGLSLGLAYGMRYVLPRAARGLVARKTRSVLETGAKSARRAAAKAVPPRGRRK